MAHTFACLRDDQQIVWAVHLCIGGSKVHLVTVCGLRPVGALTPFAQLDALYLHIFSQVQDIDRVTAILAIVILSDTASQSHVCAMLDIAYEDVDVALVDLTSVISCRFMMPNNLSL